MVILLFPLVAAQAVVSMSAEGISDFESEICKITTKVKVLEEKLKYFVRAR